MRKVLQSKTCTPLDSLVIHCRNLYCLTSFFSCQSKLENSAKNYDFCGTQIYYGQGVMITD